MNIYQEKEYPWLVWEKKVIREHIEKDKMVFGFCLGAQLIADALGSKIFPLKGKEIGWYPVRKTHHKKLNFLPDVCTVFHWHGESFELPQGAEHLYASDFTPNQAFIYKDRVLALQFHLEMTEEGIRDITHFCAHELDDSEWVMSSAKIKADYELYEYSNLRILKNLIGYIVHNNLPAP